MINLNASVIIFSIGVLPTKATHLTIQL